MIGRVFASWPALVVAFAMAGSGAIGQEQDAGASSPSGPIQAPQPPPIDPTAPPPSPAPPPIPTDRLAAIEARLEALEEQNRRLSEENHALRLQIAGPGEDAAPASPTASPASPPGDAPAPPGTSFEEITASPIPSDTDASQGQQGDRIPILSSFGQGFQFQSEDEEYRLQIHLESQTDYRAFDPNGEVYARDGFFSPRNRLLFGGRATKAVEYFLSINKGFGDLNLLDAWVNFRADDRLQLKIGRYMTPFNYEQFAIQNMWLIAPERSLFTSNLGLNRQFGAMLWGSLLDDRLDYAVGAFDGPRNSYEDFNEAKDVMAYLNVRPFQGRPEGSLLRFLNIGGSFTYGAQDNPLIPASFRVAANASNAGTADRAAPPFLIFNDGVIERGQRTFWSAHLAYFYRSLSLVADYNGSIQRFARDSTAAASVVMPTDGFAVSAGYFLTGEQPERREIVEPLKPFSLKRGSFGLGAVELIGRYSAFDTDSDVFEAGLADRDLWSDRAWVTNLGVNWYPNQFVKLYLTWQHAEFGDPVFYASPDQKALTNEMLWLRCQFYY